MRSWKGHFRRFLEAAPGRLHFTAHSHHPWPDVSLEAHQQAWLDAAQLADDKWDYVFETIWPEAQHHVATELRLPSRESVVFATNTHELVMRLLSCLPDKLRIVTSDSEFHSFERQTRRLEEDGAQVERVKAEPFDTFGERLVAASRRAHTDLVFFSQVFFNSGAIVPRLEEIVRALPSSAMVVVDGYHGFCGVPTDFSPLADRALYLAGGYKYAMSGEGVVFLHVPPALELRPRNTGWFAAFGALEEKISSRVPYAPGAQALMGATFDPSGLYRFNAVMRWRAAIGLTTAHTRSHAQALQARFLAGLPANAPIQPWQLVVPEPEHRGQFLTFRNAQARSLSAALKLRQVSTDARDDRLRFGFGVYQDEADVDALLLAIAR